MATQQARGAVERFSADDVKAWHQARGVQMAVGDVIDVSNGESMSVGFARFAKGAANRWTLTYDEALIVTKGVVTVETQSGSRTAGAGEVIYIERGTEVVYRGEEGAEVVYVTFPHWLDATQRSELASQLDEYDEITKAEADAVISGKK